MKKKLIFLLTMVLLIGILAACGDATKNDTPADPTAAPSTPTPTEGPAATDTPTPTPTPSPIPTPDPNCFFKCDFDSAPIGQVIDVAEYKAEIQADPTLAYLVFQGIGSALADFGEGKGTNGTNALVCTGRTSNWNGISLSIDEKYYGKGFHVSFDAMAKSDAADVTEMNVSLTTKFQGRNAKGKVTMLYPAYNRIIVTSVDGAWVHGEGDVFFPSDPDTDPENAGTIPQMYFECADGTGLEDIYIDNLEITIIDGVGDQDAFNAYWEEHKPEDAE